MLTLFVVCGFSGIKINLMVVSDHPRLVRDGMSQIVEVDCDDTFIPVVKHATIHIVLTISLSKS